MKRIVSLAGHSLLCRAFFPLNPVSECRKIRGNSGVCLSGVKRSEFSRGPDFPSERTDPKGGFTGCLFFRPFFWHQKKGQKNIF
ncbi:MAG: hypothetical protein ABSA71_10765 [Desulfomonilia bacterium]